MDMYTSRYENKKKQRWPGKSTRMYLIPRHFRSLAFAKKKICYELDYEPRSFQD